MRKTDLRTLFKVDDLEYIYCINLVTTEKSEVIGLTIAKANGKFIYDQTFRPVDNPDWDLIENMTDISKEIYEVMPTFDECIEEITDLFDECKGIFSFDIDLALGILKKNGLDLSWLFYRASIADDYAQISGVYDPIFRNWKKSRLNEISRIYNIEYDSCSRIEVTKTLLCIAKKASEILTLELCELRETQLNIYGEKVSVN